jgi:hypothetical protein
VFNAHKKSGRDCPLTVNGVQQASSIDGQYDVIICSPLLRAKQTLFHSNISLSNCHILIESWLCREFRLVLGDFLPHEKFQKKTNPDPLYPPLVEGRRVEWEERKKERHQSMVENLWEDSCNMSNSGIETENSILSRISLLKKFLRQFEVNRILIVGHSDFFFFFTSREIQGELFGHWIENGETYEFNNLS